MKLVRRVLTFSPVFNLGVGVVKSNVGVQSECKFESVIYLVPLLAITYTKVYQQSKSSNKVGKSSYYQQIIN